MMFLNLLRIERKIMSDNMPLYLGMVANTISIILGLIAVGVLLYKLVIKKGFKKWMRIILVITVFSALLLGFLIVMSLWSSDSSLVSKREVANLVGLVFCISFITIILVMDIQEKAMLKLEERIDDIEKALNTHSDTDHS